MNEKTSEIEKNNVFIGRFSKDWEYLNKVAPADAETGLRPNPLKLDGVDSDNIEILGNRLAAINQKARTEDDYMKIGTLFDFRILVRTENLTMGIHRSCITSSWLKGWTALNILTITAT